MNRRFAMDNSVLKKKLSTFKNGRGVLKNVSDELLIDILQAWEEWQSSSQSFYISIGANYRQMGSLMGKAKKLKRDGLVPASDFKEIKLATDGAVTTSHNGPPAPMILKWDKNKIIKFYQVDHLVDFLKKAA